jgi:transposase InsO family protein
VERLIGTIRTEFLDQVPFWTFRDLETKLLMYKEYYNSDRVHRALDGVPPKEKTLVADRKVPRMDDYRWEEHCRGLYQPPVAA